MDLSRLKSRAAWIWPAITSTAASAYVYVSDGKITLKEILFIVGLFITNVAHKISDAPPST